MIRDSFANFGSASTASFDRIAALGTHITEETNQLREGLAQLHGDAHVCHDLTQLKQRVEHRELERYIHTGQTPARIEYVYPTTIPQTSNCDTLLDQMHSGHASQELSPCSRSRSPSKAFVFAHEIGPSIQPTVHPRRINIDAASRAMSLRELDVNTMNNATTYAKNTSLKGVTHSGKDRTNMRGPERPAEASTESNKKRKLRNTMATSTIAFEGAENTSTLNLSASVGQRAGTMLGRRLRSHDRTI